MVALPAFTFDSLFLQKKKITCELDTNLKYSFAWCVRQNKEQRRVFIKDSAHTISWEDEITSWPSGDQLLWRRHLACGEPLESKDIFNYDVVVSGLPKWSLKLRKLHRPDLKLFFFTQYQTWKCLVPFKLVLHFAKREVKLFDSLTNAISAHQCSLKYPKCVIRCAYENRFILSWNERQPQKKAAYSNGNFRKTFLCLNGRFHSYCSGTLLSDQNQFPATTLKLLSYLHPCGASDDCTVPSWWSPNSPPRTVTRFCCMLAMPPIFFDGRFFVTIAHSDEKCARMCFWMNVAVWKAAASKFPAKYFLVCCLFFQRRLRFQTTEDTMRTRIRARIRTCWNSVRLFLWKESAFSFHAAFLGRARL